MKRAIIAFCGPKGSGKTTAAKRLTDVHGFQRVRFADPLKSMLRDLGVPRECLDGSTEDKERPLAILGGRSARYAMQTLGTEWGRDTISPEIWTRAWAHRVVRQPAGCGIVVDDLRFENEARMIRVAGGIVVELRREGAAYSTEHASERGLPRDLIDLAFPACPSPAALHDLVDELVRKVRP